jgi:predicted Holliday junction resolvase-like endonuclease
MDPLMLFWIFLIGIIVGVIGGITLVYKAAVSPLHTKIATLTSEQQSLATTYGKIPKHISPFMDNYPYSLQNFRFIENPVDGIQFNDDGILFVAFKTDTSQLTPTQNRIKTLIQNKKISWYEFIMK